MARVALFEEANGKDAPNATTVPPSEEKADHLRHVWQGTEKPPELKGPPAKRADRKRPTIRSKETRPSDSAGMPPPPLPKLAHRQAAAAADPDTRDPEIEQPAVGQDATSDVLPY